MRENFAGFPAGIYLPAPRVVTMRGITFPRFINSTLTTAQGFQHIRGLGPVRGLTEILVGGIAAPNASAAASLSLIARMGTVTVGTASLVTDQVDQDAATLQSIAANTVVLFQLLLWPSGLSQRFGGMGVTHGGLVTNFVTGANAVISPVARDVSTSSAAVSEGNIELGLQAVTATSGVFTMDFVRITEHPNLEEAWA